MDNRLHPDPKSSWAYIITAIVIIIFGLFWLSQREPAPVVITPQKTSRNIEPAYNSNDLEAAASAIDLIDYSEAL